MSPRKAEEKPEHPARETDLYAPVRDYLLAQGYAVQGEVRGCDLTATRDDDLVVVELKRRFSIDLLAQAADRQRVTASVYVALPASAVPSGRDGRARWKGIQHLLRRLELGLILVTFRRSSTRVEILFHPIAYERKRNNRGRTAVLREIAGRSGEHNVGGSTRRRLCTAYRESAIFVACCLERYGPLAPRRLRERGTGPKTLGILSRNVYGWFERIDRGVYALKAQGGAALAEYPDVAAHYRALLDEWEAARGETTDNRPQTTDSGPETQDPRPKTQDPRPRTTHRGPETHDASGAPRVGQGAETEGPGAEPGKRARRKKVAP